MRWVCDSVSGSCIQSTNGIYETKEECEAAGCEVIRYSCVNGRCTQTEGGTYATYDDCLASGCQVPKWQCSPSGCVLSYEGTYDTEQECLQGCAGPRQVINFNFGTAGYFNLAFTSCLSLGPYVRLRAETSTTNSWEWYGWSKDPTTGVLSAVTMSSTFWSSFTWPKSQGAPSVTNVVVTGPC